MKISHFFHFAFFLNNMQLRYVYLCDKDDMYDMVYPRQDK